MHRLLFAALCGIVIACSGGQQSGTKVTVTFKATTPFFMFRDGLDGRWQIPQLASASSYELHVHGPYAIAAVCQDAPDNGLTTLSEVYRTPDDANELEMFCMFGRAPDRVSPVTGTMLQRGAVFLGETVDSAQADNWQFGMLVPDGIYDLVAVDDYFTRVAIRRDQPVAGDTKIAPAIDLDEQAVALTELPFAVTNLAPDEHPVGFTTWSTLSHASVLFPGTTDTVPVIPDAALRPSDSQIISIGASSSTISTIYNRAQRRLLTSRALTPFTLPAKLETLRFSVFGTTFAAAWDTLPPLDTLELYVSGSSATTGVTVHHVELSASYLSATGISTMAIETALPGFARRWLIDFTKEYDERASAITTGIESTISSVADRRNAALRNGR